MNKRKLGLYLILGTITVMCSLGWINVFPSEKNKTQQLAAAMPTPKQTDIVVVEHSLAEPATTEPATTPVPTSAPTIVVKSSARSSEDLQNDELSVLEDEIIICIAYTEHFRPTTYRCHGQRLIGYGQSRIDGVLVTDSMTITERQAQKEIRKLLRKSIIPTVKKNLTRSYNRGELIACCLLAYNMGTGGFEKSEFLKAFNDGKSVQECFRNFKKTGGVSKRRWVDAAIFAGVINAYDLLECAAGGCYNFSSEYFYTSNGVDLSPEKVEDFLTSPKNQKGEKLMVIL